MMVYKIEIDDMTGSDIRHVQEMVKNYNHLIH